MQASPGTPLSTPIPMALYPVLATLLTTSGLAVTALFFVCVPAQSRFVYASPWLCWRCSSCACTLADSPGCCKRLGCVVPVCVCCFT